MANYANEGAAASAESLLFKQGEENERKTYTDARLTANPGPHCRVILEQSAIFPALYIKKKMGY